MTDRTGEEQMFARFLDDVARFQGLPDSQREEAEDLERSIRSSLNEAISDERNVKSQIGQMQKDSEALLGRIGRLAARAGVAELHGEHPTSRMPTQLNEFPHAITALQQDVKVAETSWDWVERSAAASRRTTEASTFPARPTHSAAPETEPTSDKHKRGAGRLPLVLSLVAALLIAAVVFVILL
jgi:hypothetical protein